MVEPSSHHPRVKGLSLATTIDSATTLNKTTFSKMTINITTLSIMTFSMIINKMRHSALWERVVMLSVIYAECHVWWVSHKAVFAECRYAECRYAEWCGTQFAREGENVKKNLKPSFPSLCFVSHDLTILKKTINRFFVAFAKTYYYIIITKIGSSLILV